MTSKQIATTIAAGLAGGLLFAGGTGVFNRVVTTTVTQPAVVAPAYVALAAGHATFTPADGESQDFTFTTNTRLGGWGLDRSWGETPSFVLNWNDGMNTAYRFYGDKVQVQELTSEGRGSSHTGTWTTRGGDVIITSETGAVTVLGQFAKEIEVERGNIIIRQRQLRAQQEAEARRQAAIQAETFDEMMVRLAKKVCVRAEGLEYINKKSVTAAANDVLSTFTSSDSNMARWGNMSSQLRSQRLTSRMNWECNDVAMVMHQNNLNDHVNGIMLYNMIFN